VGVHGSSGDFIDPVTLSRLSFQRQLLKSRNPPSASYYISYQRPSVEWQLVQVGPLYCSWANHQPAVTSGPTSLPAVCSGSCLVRLLTISALFVLLLHGLSPLEGGGKYLPPPDRLATLA